MSSIIIIIANIVVRVRQMLEECENRRAQIDSLRYGEIYIIISLTIFDFFDFNFVYQWIVQNDVSTLVSQIRDLDRKNAELEEQNKNLASMVLLLFLFLFLSLFLFQVFTSGGGIGQFCA